jgi:predicted nucleic acid-binding protein
VAVLLDTSYLLRFIGAQVAAINWRSVEELLSHEEPVVSEVQPFEVLLVAQRLVRKGSILPVDLARGLESVRAFSVIPLSGSVAQLSLTLLPLTRDPFDAVIAATAAVHGFTLVTLDRALRRMAATPAFRAATPDLKLLTL